MEGTLKAVVVSFFGNLAIAVAKFVGVFFTGSTSLFAEAIHSVVDSFNEVFLYLGLHLQDRPATRKYPFGYGRERFFWSFVAAMFIFTGGSLVSLYEGIEKWWHPGPVENLGWAIGILLFSFVGEAISFAAAFREFSERATTLDMDLYPFFKVTRDPTLLTVLLENAGALIGLVFAGIGVVGSVLTGDGRWDGAGSIAIGVLLGVMAFVLGSRSRALLLGQSGPPHALARIDEIFAHTPFIRSVRESHTLQMAPAELLLAAQLEISDDPPTSEANRRLCELEQQLREEVPTLRHIFLEVEPPSSEPAPSQDLLSRTSKEAGRKG